MKKKHKKDWFYVSYLSGRQSSLLAKQAGMSHEYGFTLIEILITVGIFAVVIVMISGIFLNANKLQRNTASFQRLQNDGRYIIEKLAREIRSRELDYDFIVLDGNNETGELVFQEDERGEVVVIRLTNNNLEYEITDSSNTIVDNINAVDIKVVGARFGVVPSENPEFNFEADVKPRVIISLLLENRNVAEDSQRQLALQTMVSSRIYKR